MSARRYRIPRDMKLGMALGRALLGALLGLLAWFYGGWLLLIVAPGDLSFMLADEVLFDGVHVLAWMGTCAAAGVLAGDRFFRWLARVTSPRYRWKA
jgi:hypothetical protein